MLDLLTFEFYLCRTMLSCWIACFYGLFLNARAFFVMFGMLHIIFVDLNVSEITVTPKILSKQATLRSV